MPTGQMAPDAMNVNVVPRRGIHLPPDDNPLSQGGQSSNPAEEEILVHTDFNMLQVCDAETLQPKRLLTYAEIDPELSGFGICAHPPKDRKRGTTYNYLISKEGVMSIFAMHDQANPAKLLWKTPLPCPPCYIHSLAMTEKYVVFVRNVGLQLFDSQLLPFYKNPVRQRHKKEGELTVLLASLHECQRHHNAIDGGN